MEQVFLTILNMSITASFLVLAVMILRLIFRRAPKSLVVVMWALVGIRLICPFSVESGWSLLPSAQMVPEDILVSDEGMTEDEKQPVLNSDSSVSVKPSIEVNAGQTVEEDESVHAGINEGTEPSVGKDVVQNTSNPAGTEAKPTIDNNLGTNAGQATGIDSVSKPDTYTDSVVDTEKDTVGAVSSKKTLISVASAIWIVGVAVMLAYSMITYLRLRQKVSISLLVQENVCLCDSIDTPFILGIFKPYIYLPSGMEDSQIPYVMEHERAHLMRKDHWWKPLGLVLLAIHWFNPLMWAAYSLLCRDIELACDEKVIKNMGNMDKKGYSEALLTCGVQHRMILACPLAFGEVGVLERVRSVKNYKKPAFWIVAIGVVLCIALAVGFLTNPKEDKISMVMYNDIVYAEAEKPESARSYVYVGEIESFTKEQTPTKNFQANEDLTGCKVYEALNTKSYIFVKKDETYIPYKNVNVENVEASVSEIMELESIEAYFIEYCENYVTSSNEELNQLMENVAYYNGGLDINEEKNVVEITIIGCTDEKMDLFQEYIIDSEQIVFENFTASMLGLPMEPDKEVDWGLTMTAREVTPTGLTLVFDQSGVELEDDLLTGTDFHLCVLENGEWKPVEYKKSRPAWAGVGISIYRGNITKLSQKWENMYGELPYGTYRIGKSVSYRASGTYEWEEAYFFADFVIDEGTYSGELVEEPTVLPRVSQVSEPFMGWYENEVVGLSKEQVREGWGEPDATLSGFDGDVWNANDAYSVVVYYDENGLAYHAKLHENITDTGNIAGGTLSEYDTAFIRVKWFDILDENSNLYTHPLNTEFGGKPKRIPIYKFESVADVEQFKKDMADELIIGERQGYYNETPSFEVFTSGMNEAYFEEYTVFTVYVPSNSLSWKYGLTGCDKTGQKLSIHMEQTNHPYALDDDQSGWFVLIPFEKSEIEDIQNFDAYLYNEKDYLRVNIQEINDAEMVVAQSSSGEMILDKECVVPNWFYPEHEVKVGDGIYIVYDGEISENGEFNKIYEMFFWDEEANITAVFPEE